MKFSDLFKDDNDINEKYVIGFIAFVIMILFAFADLISGALGQQLVINDIIYNSFVWVVLGSFGIAEAGKAFGNRTQK
tara:strand:+ start:98 stop:331 length:234 start_codon:yes stop_codon:yes gene_type:complete